MVLYRGKHPAVLPSGDSASFIPLPDVCLIAMVEVNFRGPVEKRETTRREKSQDGSDTQYCKVEVVERVEVEGCVEYPDGYVNLEGFSPDRMGMGIEETSLARFIPDGYRVVEGGEWEVSIDGNMKEWAIQARRYIQERPDMTVEEALRAFEGWEETTLDAEYTIEEEL